jgi:branched-chain amino acid transport system ATP-binding protein
MEPPALALHSVSKSFGALQALDGVTLAVAVGERRALIGPNGAGKTTLFQIMSGMLSPTAGRIELFGSNVTHRPIHQRVALGLARTFQITNLFTNLTVEQNVILALQGLVRTKFNLLRPVSRERALFMQARTLLEEWQLAERRASLVRELSYGEQRALEILLAVCQHPRLLLLDEPTAGLSPAETLVAAALVRHLPREMAIVIIEHDMDVAFSLCETVTVLHAGKVLATGEAEAVRRDPAVRSIYLGPPRRQDTSS